MVSVTSLPSLRFEQDPGPTMLNINVYEPCRANESYNLTSTDATRKTADQPVHLPTCLP